MGCDTYMSYATVCLGLLQLEHTAFLPSSFFTLGCQLMQQHTDCITAPIPNWAVSLFFEVSSILLSFICYLNFALFSDQLGIAALRYAITAPSSHVYVSLPFLRPSGTLSSHSSTNTCLHSTVINSGV